MKVLSPLVQALALSAAAETLAAPLNGNGPVAPDDSLSTNTRANYEPPAPRQDIDALDKRKGGGGGKGGSKGGGFKGGGVKGGSGKSGGSGSSSNGASWGVCGPVAGAAATLGAYGGLKLGGRLSDSTAVQATTAIVGGVVGGAAGVAYCVVQEARIAKDKKKAKDQPPKAETPSA